MVSIHGEMTADLFVACLIVGGALLAAWFLVRFEHVGPRSLIGSMSGWVVSGILIVALPALINGIFAWGLPASKLLAVFGLVLPVFTYFFLAGAWFMRTVLRVTTGLG